MTDAVWSRKRAKTKHRDKKRVPLDAVTLSETLSDDGREVGHLGVPLRTKTILEPLQNLIENVNGYTLANFESGPYCSEHLIELSGGMLPFADGVTEPYKTLRVISTVSS